MIEILTMLFSVIAIITSAVTAYFSWYKSRAIYDIEKYKFPKNVGDSKTDEDKKHEQTLKEKLKIGNWQILYVYERNVNNELMIVIGKIKK